MDVKGKHLDEEGKITVLSDIPDDLRLEAILHVQLIENAWSVISEAHLQLHVTKCLENSNNPFWTALYLYITCKNKREKAKNDHLSLSLAILDQFRNWILTMKNIGKGSKYKKLCAKLTPDVKNAAFLLVYKRASSANFRVMSSIYGFSENMMIFKNHIDKLLKDEEYVAACHCVVELKMQRFFTPCDILLPLFIQEKYNLVHLYLRDDSDERNGFIKCLDELTVAVVQRSVSTYVGNLELCRKISGLKLSKLNKSIVKLAKTLNVTKDHWPNVARLQAKNVLTYVINRCAKSTLPDEDLEEFVSKIAGYDLLLQGEAVTLLACCNEMLLAHKLTKKWDLLKHNVDVPAAVKQGCPRNFVPRKKFKFSDDAHHYRAARLKDIKLVQGVEDYENCIQDLQKNYTVIGMDVEWRPCFFGEPEKLAIMQIATEGKCYLLDFPGLLATLRPYHWYGLVEKVFANKDIRKLGFSAENDWRILSGAHFALEKVGRVTVNYVDLDNLCSKILKTKPDLFPFYNPMNLGDIRKTSLSVFVHLCFNSHLDKTEQFSNWDRRPLRNTQIQYAANDACCLIDMYNVLQERMALKGLQMLQFQ